MLQRSIVSVFGIAALLFTMGGCGVRTEPADSGDVTSAASRPVATNGNDRVTGGSEGSGQLNAPPVNPTCSQVDPTKSKIGKMLDIPSAEFQMGCNEKVDDECLADEQPPHKVALDAFEIDMTEVTQAQYFACVQSGKCTAPTCAWDPCKKAEYPIGCVAYSQAQAYCSWAGKRLPTEAEWEFAARGVDSRKYPWGNTPPSCEVTNMGGCGGWAVPVASYPKGVSPFGVSDMAGNVVEWVADIYSDSYYATSPITNPRGADRGTDYVGRGGGFLSQSFWQRTGVRDSYGPKYTRESLGFRCAR